MKSGLGLARSVSLILLGFLRVSASCNYEIWPRIGLVCESHFKRLCIYIGSNFWQQLTLEDGKGAETWLEAKFGEDIAALRTLIRCIVAPSCQPLGVLKHDFALPFFFLVLS
jgi:hypothetical protein